MKPSLLFVITQLYRGGAETALINLLRALRPEEYDVDLLVLSQTGEENSLIGCVPSWVRLCNAGKENRPRRFNMTREALLLGGDTARQFVADKTYDFAFSYGEWCPLSFVAEQVHARNRTVWIHTDITMCPSFHERTFFDAYYRYDRYIFVSEGTKERAEARYPFLNGKSTVVHNLLNREALLRLAGEPVKDFVFPQCAVKLITVANVRTEKGYPRMLETAKLLRERGIDLCWLCVGPPSDPTLADTLHKQVREWDMEDNFVLLGGRKNPHPYIAQADAFVLLSDYEAWPLAMAEAMMLGTPAIATNTVGARALLRHEESGLICSFEPENAADEIERFVTDETLNRRIRGNISGFAGVPQALDEFRRLIAESA